jgi:UDP-N-acetylglucosamine--N-acetylmuramyl-(pentapeptide) pyrophosphoryl-undecaprenol N-acetylglucosamine transferase
MQRTFLFAGGGTGGHLAPGIAVAEELRRRDPSCQILFVGAGRPIESRMLGPTGFGYRKLPSQQLNQLFTHPTQFIRESTKSMIAASRILNEVKPTAVIGLGGYASVPLVLASGARGTPVWLLEQNALPGRANRWLSNWFPICLAFPSAAHWLSLRAKIHNTGNPIRSSLLRHTTSHKEEEPCNSHTSPSHHRTILVLGGSQGSSAINHLVPAVMATIRQRLSDWKILHQTGDADKTDVSEAYRQAGISAIVEPFFDDIGAIYRTVSFAITRSGATTLTELAIFGTPAILIPLPHSADQHQAENALVFQFAGAAKVVLHRTDTMTASDMRETLVPLVENPSQLTKMSQSMLGMACPNAASHVVDLITDNAMP